MSEAETAARELLARVSPCQKRGYEFLQLAGKQWIEVDAAIAALTEQSATIALLREALKAVDGTNTHYGAGPHCTCSQRQRELIIAEALDPTPEDGAALGAAEGEAEPK